MEGDRELATAAGVHRSLEPPGDVPGAAWRLDNRPDLWPGETLLELELIVVDTALDEHLRDVAGGPDRVPATVAEVVAGAGKLTDRTGTASGTVTGRVVRHHPDVHGRPPPGTPVAAPGALRAVPLWLSDLPSYVDGRTLAARGHAVVVAAVPLVALPETTDRGERLELVAALDGAGALAAVRRHLPDGGRLAVVGGDTVGGALAAVTAREAGAGAVAATVTTLDGARQVAAVGAATAVVVHPDDPVGAARALRARLEGGADLVVVTAAVAAALPALTSAPRGVIAVVGDAVSLSEVAREARTLAPAATVVASGAATVAEHAAVVDLWATWPALARAAGGRGPA